MKGRTIRYSAAEIDWLQANAALPRRNLHAAFVARFGRTDVSIDNLKSLCTRRGWKTGRTGRYPKGSVPFNKGRKGYRAPGSEKGWFAPGTRQGRAAQNYKPIGTERVVKGGYIQRKVNDDMPLQRRWKMLHLINWEAVNGPLPAGQALKCRDGNRQNTDASNWEAVPRALLPRLAGRWSPAYDTAPPDLRPAILATARLDHAARQARKQATAERPAT